MHMWGTARQVLAAMACAMTLCLPAALHGQAFVFPDTFIYIRSFDAIFYRLGGESFASKWSPGGWYYTASTDDADAPLKDGVLRGSNTQAQAPSAAETVGAPSLAASARIAADGAPPQDPAADEVATDDDVKWKGRSIYYSAFVYLTEHVGSLWLTIFLQGLMVAAATMIFLQRVFRLPLAACIPISLALATLSPAGAYVSFAMPDVLGGVGVLAAATLFAAWRRLSLIERTVLFGLVTFSAASHTASFLGIAGLTALAGMIAVAARVLAPLERDQRPAWSPIAVVAMAVVAAAGLDMAHATAYGAMTGDTLRRAPITTAEIIERGPGERFIRERCDDAPFAVCAFESQLPVADSDHFLFSDDPDIGVMKLATPAVRLQIAEQQPAFLVAVASSYPGETLAFAFRNWGEQLTRFGIENFSYHDVYQTFFDNLQLPAQYYERLTASAAYREAVPTTAVGTLFAVVMILAVLGAIVGTADRAARHGLFDPVVIAGALLAAGVVGNAAICGILAGPYDRFGGRVAWVLPLLAIAMAVAAWPRVQQMAALRTATRA